MKERTKNFGSISEEELCSFNVWHGERDMADISIPDPCTGCGGISGGASWVSDMMFDDETEAAPSSYGIGADARTLWIRESFKLFNNLFFFNLLINLFYFQFENRFK